jgi:hypothetical protein
MFKFYYMFVIFFSMTIFLLTKNESNVLRIDRLNATIAVYRLMHLNEMLT